MLNISKPYNIIYLIIILSALSFISYFYFDKPASLFFHSLSKDSLFIIMMQHITEYGKGIYGVLGVLLLWFFAFVRANKQKRIEALYLTHVLIMGGILVALLKVLLGRARPKLLFLNNDYGFFGFKMKAVYWSFPSGHTLTSLSLMTALSLLYPKYRYIFIVWFGVIAFSRVAVCAHYPSDVIIGGLLGALISLYIYQSLYLHRMNDAERSL